jgi:histidine ammonia-lyase
VRWSGHRHVATYGAMKLSSCPVAGLPNRAGQLVHPTSIPAVSGGRTVTISSGPLSLEELLEIAHGASCELDASALAVIDDSRAVVDAVLATGKPVYGLNTGLGHAKDTRLAPDAIRALQVTMLRRDAGAMGPPLRMDLVRAAMAARVNGMARGGSGASRACATTLASMLNAGVHPVVPGFGSVGAGDLGQMAAIALVAIGEGRAELKGELVSGAVALERAGISPLQLEAKDALSLMSHNGVSIGHGATVVARAKRALEAADIVAALSLEATSGNTSAFDPVVAAAKGIRGQAEVSSHIRGLVEGSAALDPAAERTIQDPLSFRVVPQVHGALWEFIELAGHAVETELNAMTDNPLVSRAERRMVHNGNFHPMVLALSFDAIRPAIAHVGQLSDRRLNHLWAATFSNPRNLQGHPRGLSLRYASAAAAAQLRQLADTASLDVPPVDFGVEDHATGAPLSVMRTDSALDRLEDIVVVELLMARDLLLGGEVLVGVGTRAVLDFLGGAAVQVPHTASAADLHAAVKRSLTGGLLDAARRANRTLAWTGPSGLRRAPR